MDKTFISNKGYKILKTELGYYSVQKWKGFDWLIYYADLNDVQSDNGCDVTDLYDLTKNEYKTLTIELKEHFNYNLNGRFYNSSYRMNKKTNIKVDRTQREENCSPPDTQFKFPSMDYKQTLEEVTEIINMNNGRILKVEITLSNNIYRTNTETETITISHKENK